MRFNLTTTGSYHLHVALQFADAGSLALGGAHVAQVMDGDGGTGAGIHLSTCGRRGEGRGEINELDDNLAAT